MADKELWLGQHSNGLPIKVVDNGDGSYSLSVSLSTATASPTGDYFNLEGLNLASGGTTTLTTTLSSNQFLLGVTFGSSVACKWIVSNDTVLVDRVFTPAVSSFQWKPLVEITTTKIVISIVNLSKKQSDVYYTVYVR